MTQKIKVALVTGADGALGAVVARKFAAAGITVVGTRLGQGGQELSALDKDGIRWLPVNLSRSAEVKAAFRTLEAQKLAVDALVHCAGGFRYGELATLTDEDFEFLVDANLKSSFFLAREAIVGMKARGYGRILFISSKVTLAPPANMAAYAATKIALNALTVGLADEVKGQDITVNAVLPSVIDTPANRAAMPNENPAKWVSPAALADILFHFTQPASDAVTGALLTVNGRV